MVIEGKLDISYSHGFISLFTPLFLTISEWSIVSEISQDFWDSIHHMLLKIKYFRVIIILTLRPNVSLVVVIHLRSQIKLHSVVRGCHGLQIEESRVQSGCLLHVVDQQ